MPGSFVMGTGRPPYDVLCLFLHACPAVSKTQLGFLGVIRQSVAIADRYLLPEDASRLVSQGFLPAGSPIIGADGECRGISVREQSSAWIAQDLPPSLSDL
jgi:hypothetical protein